MLVAAYMEKHPGSPQTIKQHLAAIKMLFDYLVISQREPDSPLFPAAIGKTGRLTDKPLRQQDAYRIVERRAKATRIQTRIGNHTFRATGITAYLKNSGKLEVAQHIANHESPRTTKLYDRRQDEISLDEIERIAI
jgi:site-specific recombinase XerC